MRYDYFLLIVQRHQIFRNKKNNRVCKNQMGSNPSRGINKDKTPFLH